MTKTSIETRIVKAIIDDLTDRRGLRQAFEECDEEVQKEIFAAWKKTVRTELKKPTE